MQSHYPIRSLEVVMNTRNTESAQAPLLSPWSGPIGGLPPFSPKNKTLHLPKNQKKAEQPPDVLQPNIPNIQVLKTISTIRSFDPLIGKELG